MGPSTPPAGFVTAWRGNGAHCGLLAIPRNLCARRGAPRYAQRVDADDLVAAWSELELARPSAWRVGQPYSHDEAACWEQYAYDPTERPVDGKRNREWTAVAPTEVGVVLS
jgi:hypothetical protein